LLSAENEGLAEAVGFMQSLLQAKFAESMVVEVCLLLINKRTISQRSADQLQDRG